MNAPKRKQQYRPGAARTIRLMILLLAAVVAGTSNAAKKGTHSMNPPGVVIDQSSDAKRIYIGSPSLAILPDGSYVASHDFFGPGTNFDTTAVFRSADKGKTWEKAATLKGQFWSRLFVVQKKLYILGSAGQWGTLVIRRSTDQGRTWTKPKDADSGVVRAASKQWLYGIASGAALIRDGRIYKSAVRRKPGPRRWGQPLEFVVLSAAIDADLLQAASWRESNGVSSHPHPDGMFLTDEGNIVADREGKLFNILRVHEPEKGGIAGLLEVSADGRKHSFDRDKGYFPFPGGCKKFTIRYDAKSDRWWSLTNWAQKESLKRAVNAERTRNTLALTSAKTLDTWQVESIILFHGDVRDVGFQYADWHVDGDDIVLVSRTAFGDVTNCHNANYLTFHRIENFRQAARPVTAEDKSTNQEMHDIVNLGRAPKTPVHAPSLFDTGQSLLVVHGFSKVGEKEAWGDIYRSTDGGKTWTHRGDLPTYYCGSFFALGDAVYLLYADFRHDNKLRIRRSVNDGIDWSKPVTIHDQALWDGNGAWARHKGYLYKALDEKQPDNGKGSRSLPRVARIKLDADPMDPKNWSFSDHPSFEFPPPKEVRDVQVENGQVRRNNNEGNCVVGPGGKLWVVYRHFERTRGNFSATVFYDDKTNAQLFRNVYEADPAKGKENCYSDFPGGCSGFHIAFDKTSGKYLALSNPVTGETQYPDGKRLGIYRCMRNVLVLLESEDLVHWRIAKHLLKDELETTWEDAVKHTGFQQINFVIQDDDLIWVSRTAYDGASNLHDANRITFHRLRNFRQYLDSDGEVAYYSFDDPQDLGRDTCKQAGRTKGNAANPVNVEAADGKYSGAAAFDGRDAGLDARYHVSTEFHRAAAVTVAAWVHLDALPKAKHKATIFDSAIHQDHVGVGLGIADGQLTLAARSDRQDSCQLLSVPAPSTKTWFHVTAVYDFRGKALELYIDGKRVKKQKADFANDVMLRGIPGERDVIGKGLAGRLDELHIYRRRLPAKEIRSLSRADGETVKPTPR